jgi:hypothetical protein
MFRVKNSLYYSILSVLSAASAAASVNPTVPFYGSAGTITANPAYPIVGENTHIQVVVGNSGDQPASNVQVKVSFNDWGVTFNGWQEIGTVTIPTIAAGGSSTVDLDYVFQNRTHTCLEALIVGAVQNDNPDDDRGQINLEVINSGETFSYGVPIRNNGDAPLHLLLLGRCVAKAGTVQADCQGIEEKVDLAPGEEIIVPLKLDLSAVAPGQEVGFILDAFDLGAADPYAPANHNHVHLRIKRTTAKKLKIESLALLGAVRAQLAPGARRNQVDEAARHIQLALESKAWLGDSRLKPAGGAQVFAQEGAAITSLLQLLASDLALSLKTSLNEAVLKLTDADKILAQTANQVAGGDAGATGLILLGDLERQAGEYFDAIKEYRDAWQKAVR